MVPTTVESLRGSMSREMASPLTWIGRRSTEVVCHHHRASELVVVVPGPRITVADGPLRGEVPPNLLERAIADVVAKLDGSHESRVTPRWRAVRHVDARRVHRLPHDVADGVVARPHFAAISAAHDDGATETVELPGRAQAATVDHRGHATAGVVLVARERARHGRTTRLCRTCVVPRLR